MANVQAGEKNKYGVVIGSPEDKEIRAQIESYMKLLKWGPKSLEKMFPEDDLFDVKKVEQYFRALRAYVELRVLIASDGLYQTVRRELQGHDELGKVTAEPMAISRVRPRLSKEYAMRSTVPYENLMSDDWYKCVINEKLKDGSVVPYFGYGQYSSEGTIPCVSTRGSSSFVTAVQQRTTGRDRALVLKVPPLARSATGGFVMDRRQVKGRGKGKGQGKGKGKGLVKGMAKAKGKAKAKAKAKAGPMK